MAKKKKVKTKKKNKVSVDELNAYNMAYGDELGRKDYFSYVILPGILMAAFGTILLYNPIVSIVMFIIGIAYGWLFFFPKSIRKNYLQMSFDQRNKFINNMTQVMTDSTKTVLDALNSVTMRADGEFKDDLMRLQAGLFGSNKEDIKFAIDELSEKYEDDVIFVQYMEQIETAMLEGNSNIEALKDIKEYHNQMKTKQEYYGKMKQAHVSDMMVMAFTIVVFVLALTFSFGFETYLSAFAHTIVGYITVGLYLLILSVFLKQFSTYLFDDSVTSISS